MSIDNRWLVIEPYVRIIRRNGSVLLYNTINHAVLEFHHTPEIDRIAEKLLEPVNGLVIPLDKPILNHPEIIRFIHELRTSYSGDLFEPGWASGKPVNLFPDPFIKYGLFNPETGLPPSVEEIDPKNYLQEVTLILNTAPSDHSDHLQMAFRQFGYPAAHSAPPLQMEKSFLLRIFSDINRQAPAMIHLSGNNILGHPDFQEINKVLKSNPYPRKYHISSTNLDPHSIIQLVSQPRTTLAIYFPELPESAWLQSHLNLLSSPVLRNRTEHYFVIRNEQELQKSVQMTNFFDIPGLFFKPLYTGENMQFFKDQVFSTREEILAGKPDQQQIFSRISVNEMDFGKFTVFPDGTVFANLSDIPLGDYNRMDLRQLIHAELSSGVSWKRTRASVEPCRGCLYQFLCPPVSSYELVMNRFHFCTVFQEKSES